MGNEATREQVKLLMTIFTAVVTLLVGGLVTWMSTQINLLGQSVARLETIQQERTEQMRRMETLVSQIVPRAEIETKLLDINTRLSNQQLETTRLSLEIEKIKAFETLTHSSTNH